MAESDKITQKNPVGTRPNTERMWPWCHGMSVSALWGVLMRRFQTGWHATSRPTSCSMILSNLLFCHTSMNSCTWHHHSYRYCKSLYQSLLVHCLLRLLWPLYLLFFALWRAHLPIMILGFIINSCINHVQYSEKQGTISRPISAIINVYQWLNSNKKVYRRQNWRIASRRRKHALWSFALLVKQLICTILQSGTFSDKWDQLPGSVNHFHVRQ